MPTGDQNVTDIARPTRGLKNRNPGNLRFVPSVRWLGEVGDDTKGFSVFDTDVNGLRACVIDLHTHYIRDGQNTIRKAITCYAPPNENNTESYIAFVAMYTDIGPDKVFVFTPDVAAALLEAIVRIEQGVQPYDAATITEAVDAAFHHFGAKA